MSEQKTFEYVKYLWHDEDADRLSGVDRLVYRSNKLGEDLTLTNTGGGNTSSKLKVRDPLTQEEVEVVLQKLIRDVKGCGVLSAMPRPGTSIGQTSPAPSHRLGSFF